jgi:hypothetical protein
MRFDRVTALVGFVIIIIIIIIIIFFFAIGVTRKPSAEKGSQLYSYTVEVCSWEGFERSNL